MARRWLLGCFGLVLLGTACGRENVSDGGIQTINDDPTTHQQLVVSSTGTDFSISTSDGVTTFALPSASAGVTRGLVTAADWSIFNDKIGSINGDKSVDQTFTTAATGSDFGISTSGGVTTFSLPDASDTARGLVTSADWSIFNAKVGSINGDTAVDHVLAAGSAGNDFSIATAGGTTTFNLPDASAMNRGLLVSADWTTFNAKLGALVDDTTPTLGGNLSTGGFQVVSPTDTNITLAPAGDGLVEVTKAITRKGFFQAYSNAAEALPSTAGSFLPVSLTAESRVDTDYYTHDTVTNPNEITVRVAGDYKISYTVAVQRNNGRHGIRAWLEANDVELIASKSYCIVRNDNEADTCTVQATTIANLAADDVLELIVQGRRQDATWGLDNDADTVPNEVWVTIEKI